MLACISHRSLLRWNRDAPGRVGVSVYLDGDGHDVHVSTRVFTSLHVVGSVSALLDLSTDPGFGVRFRGIARGRRVRWPFSRLFSEQEFGGP
jgi:hypothetical protein